MESRDDQRRGGGNPAPATTCIILSRSGAGYLGSYVNLLINAIRADIINSMAKARASLKANDNLLIY